MRFSWRTSLRNKVVLIVLVAMVGLIGSLYALSRLVLMRGFSHLEDDFVTENIGRASSALANEIDTLRQTNEQYAARDQSYESLNSKNPESIHSEFTSRTSNAETKPFSSWKTNRACANS